MNPAKTTDPIDTIAIKLREGRVIEAAFGDLVPVAFGPELVSVPLGWPSPAFGSSHWLVGPSRPRASPAPSLRYT